MDDGELSTIEQALFHWLEQCPGAVVAYSGGVDSAVVAYASHSVLGQRALAVIADSPSLARSELTAARSLADTFEIPLRVLPTAEVSDAAYQANDSQRCFHCKTHLFTGLNALSEVMQQGWWILSGTNLDDLGDWRPGLRAASEHAVRSPLAELGISKSVVRQLAARWGLPVADKPASPCLASRLAYGLEVTPERLAMVEAAEAELRQLGLVQFRVRLHAENLARIEVPLSEISLLVNESVRQQFVRRLAEIGFRYVTLDLEGFSSGSLNRLISISKP